MFRGHIGRRAREFHPLATMNWPLVTDEQVDCEMRNYQGPFTHETESP